MFNSHPGLRSISKWRRKWKIGEQIIRLERVEIVCLFRHRYLRKLGHPKTQTMQTADCRPCRPCRPCRLCRLSTFLLTLGSLCSVQQFQNTVPYVLMFVIYSQAAPHKPKHPTVDSIREMCLIGYVWKIPFTAPQ